MKKIRVFKLKDLIGGSVEKGVPVEVSKKKIIEAFKALGIEIEDYAYLEYGSLNISIRWENDKAVIIFY